MAVAAIGPAMVGPLRRMVVPLTPAGRLLLDAVLPPRCLGCGAAVAEPGALCATCWPGLSFITPPWCARCGYPFDYDPGPDALCAGCIASPPPYRRGRAALRYDEASRRLVLAFKHGDRTEMAPALTRWLAGAADLSAIDLIAAVPLHWRRLFVRRYNQAALLALGLARLAGKPAIPDLLLRRRATPSQGHLGALARRRNVAGAFAVNPVRRPALAGRRVLLVDDVMTSGATVAACSRVLLREGAAAVDVLAVARVIRPGRL
jgi:ComF family protein